MRTSKTPFKLQRNYYPQFAMGALVFFGAFLLSAVVASIFAPVSESLAESKTDSNDITGFYVTITNSDNVALSVDATPVVNVKTNAPLGYKLLISANNTNLSSGSAGNTGVFSASVGTSSNPVTLSPNTWGYSMDEKSLPIPSTDSTWIGITTTPTQISSSTYATTEDGDNYDIYYGINATTSLPTDTYSTTVTYTAIAEGITENAPLMQNYTYAECNYLSNGSSTTLMDVRNGANYRITKLADGNCWMTQNLRLDGGITLTSADTNLPTGTTITLPANIKTGEDIAGNSTMQIIRNESNDDGNLYNWCAATLTGNCLNVNTEPTQDICPKGWKLPSTSGNPSYANLFSAGGVSGYVAAEASPYLFTRSGYYHGTTISDNGASGHYWSSTPYSASVPSVAYSLYYSTDTFIASSNGWNKGNGFSVRCVFKGEDITRLTYMQDITTALCQNTPEGVTTSLLDRRGYGNGGSNKTTRYGVIKAKDGNCWMTDNLNLYNVNISYAYSDFTNGSFKIPASEDYGDNDITVKTAYIHVASGVGDNADKTNKYGTYGQVYYNWVTTAINSSTSSGTVSWSICPKNWRLPANGDANTNYSYQKLFNAYNLNTTSEVVANSELGIKNTGCWYSGYVTEHAQGTGFRLWTGTAASAGQAYSLGYNSDLTSNISRKTQGFSVRCVAR